MCSCGCNTCETITGPLLTEGKVKSLLSEGLQYHIDKKIPLFETVYRIGSEKHLSLIKEARKMYSRNVIDLCEEDEALIKTHLGEFALYEGESVPLDLPMLNEDKKLTYNDFVQMTRDDMMAGAAPDEYPSDERVRKYAKALYSRYLKGASVDDLFEAEFKYDKEEVTTTDKMLTVLSVIDGKRNLANDQISQLFKDNVGGTFYIYTNEEGEYENLKPISKQDAFKYIDYYNSRLKKDYKREEKLGAELGILGIESELMFNKGEFQTDPSVFSVNESELDEAEFKGKDVPLNKPKRGGSKAYYVYVRDPKTKKIKKVSFGSGGLRAKIKNKKARNAYSARHRCPEKKDRTKAGYWSCNLPRYASALGLGANMNTFW